MSGMTLLSAIVSIAAPQAVRPANGHRLQLVRATDGTPIAGAELFDIGADSAGRAAGWSLDMLERADDEFPRRSVRRVADGEGRVELGAGRYHALLARAPGWFQLDDLYDCERRRDGTLALLPDRPLTIELVDAHGKAATALPVELVRRNICGCDPLTNSNWREQSDRDGVVAFPHFLWWLTDDITRGAYFLAPAFPLADPPFLHLSPLPYTPRGELPFMVQSISWELPPLSKVRFEFEGTETLPEPRTVTFELIGPRQFFGDPDHFTSRDGAALEMPAEVGVPLQARFRWGDIDEQGRPTHEHFALGRADASEGGVATLHASVASDPIELRLRPIRGDGAPLAALAQSSELARFDLTVEWKDARGVTWRDLFSMLIPDETGALRFAWRRPRFATERPPATIKIALRPSWHRYGWEPLDETELASRDLPWPTGSSLDVGTLIVPSAK